MKDHLPPILIIILLLFFALRPDKWAQTPVPTPPPTSAPTMTPIPQIIQTPETIIQQNPVVFVETVVDYSQFGQFADTAQWFLEIGPIVLAFLFMASIAFGLGLLFHVAYLDRMLDIKEREIKLRQQEIKVGNAAPSDRAPVIINTPRTKESPTVKIGQLDILKSKITDFVIHAYEEGLNKEEWIDRGFSEDEFDTIMHVLEEARLIIPETDEFEAIIKEGKGDSKMLGRYFGLSIDDLNAYQHS